MDINDNPPEFEHTLYMGEVREDNGVGTSVVQVLATSKDAGINAEIEYSIVSGNDKQKFRIHAKSGKYTFPVNENFLNCFLELLKLMTYVLMYNNNIWSHQKLLLYF